MFRKILVANRGEIACRILRTLKKMGVASVAVYSDVDEFSSHVLDADEAVGVGGARPSESYLAKDRILDVALRTGAEAIHPGYGFLSERADFAQACESAGVRFIGPTPEQIREFGRKHRAREVAAAHGVPLLPGTPLLDTAQAAVAAADAIGYPVILKSTAGGGGIGLRVCRDERELSEAFEAVERLGRANFGDSGSYLERFVERARHIEVQIFGDGLGEVVVMGERDCSAQRRNQKVIEETPASGLASETRDLMYAAALRMGRAVRYRSAGTVEFVVDASTQEFFFLEVNTRLQVEHGVTEAVTGIDLVEWMVRQAAGCLDLRPVFPRGAAIEVRIYAEDPAKQHQPCTGVLTELVWGGGVRVDGWVQPGSEITPYYDPLLAKVIAHGPNRREALHALETALSGTRIAGLETNLAYLRQVIATEAFRTGTVTTRLLGEVEYRSTSIDVVDGGTQTTVQDSPGRIGYWAVGVPPSGPMDDVAFTDANRTVGNERSAAALEMTLHGPTLRFRADAVIALAGARMKAILDGNAVPFLEPVTVRSGSELRLGGIEDRGFRTYLAVRGGIDVPSYLGSRATFMLGRFGGHGGRALRAGDVLPIGGESPTRPVPSLKSTPAFPEYPAVWQIGVMDGPHGAPDFFTDEDIAEFYEATWQVHHNSDRTGIRLIGPKPRWARRDGGEAGLHPSNIHDNAYAVGTVDYTGDMPVILGPDGPSLGGFVCPVTIVRAERWKMGQLKPGDRIRFARMTDEEVEDRAGRSEAFLSTFAAGVGESRVRPEVHVFTATQASPAAGPILGELTAAEVGERVVYRRDGGDYLLVEYGPPVLNLGLRLRAHALMQALERSSLRGIIDLTPGIRSLQIHHDPTELPSRRLLAFVRDLERDLPNLDEIEIPTRTVAMPLSWNDPATLMAIEKYTRSVRADAPWCPSNIEFIRRINGLSSVDEVRKIVFDASYLVLGLGDVYLGAPVATPLDPRHRLVTTKYNPARTWTPENAVGIGGAYMCIYGMEGPGGYQFVGRTLQVWNTHGTTADFGDGKRHLLRFFDEIRFYPVEADELLSLRKAFPHGKTHVRIDESTFRYTTYKKWLTENAQSIGVFKAQQQAAFDAERDRWRLAGQDIVAPSPPSPVDHAERPVLPEGSLAVLSPIAGSVWKLVTEVGARVKAGDPLVIVEAMKTEIVVSATTGGVVRDLLVAPGGSVVPGQVVAVLDDVSA
jgi:urea carboxylase